MKKFIVSEKYLDDTINKASRNLVGKVMKRFEILTNAEDLKKEVKELIYENYRVMKSIIEAFSCGVEFKPKPRQPE